MFVPLSTIKQETTDPVTGCHRPHLLPSLRLSLNLPANDQNEENEIATAPIITASPSPFPPPPHTHTQLIDG